MKCFCHSAHLCASHACEKLLRMLEDLVRDIYSHFAHSAKRLDEYKQFQSFTNTEPQKILKPSRLSLEQRVRQLLEQWPALELYFQKSAEKDRLVTSQNIYAALTNPIIKLYFQFLSFVLPKFTNFNKLFQSQTPNIHFLTSYLATTYKAFLSCYLHPSYIRSLSLEHLDPASSTNFLPLTGINMGEKVSQFMTQLPNILSPLKMKSKDFWSIFSHFMLKLHFKSRSAFPSMMKS